MLLHGTYPWARVHVPRRLGTVVVTKTMEADNREIFEAVMQLLGQLTAAEIERALSAANLGSGRSRALYTHSQQSAKDDLLNHFRIAWNNEQTRSERKARESLLAIAKQCVKDGREEQLRAVLKENRLQFILDFSPNAAQPTPSDAPPTVSVKQVRTALDAVITAETAEEIDQATRQRFSEAPATVVAEAKRAKDTTIALKFFLDDLRLNSPEAEKALELLDKQANALDNIIAILQSDGDKEAARKTLRDLLHDVLESYLQALAEKGPTRGILAAAALVSLSLTGVEVTYIVAALVAAPIIGLDVNALKKILTDWKKKKDEGE